MIREDGIYIAGIHGYYFNLRTNDKKNLGHEWKNEDGSHELVLDPDFKSWFELKFGVQAKVKELPVNKLFFNKEQWKKICNQG